MKGSVEPHLGGEILQAGAEAGGIADVRHRVERLDVTAGRFQPSVDDRGVARDGGGVRPMREHPPHRRGVLQRGGDPSERGPGVLLVRVRGRVAAERVVLCPVDVCGPDGSARRGWNSRQRAPLGVWGSAPWSIAASSGIDRSTNASSAAAVAAADSRLVCIDPGMPCRSARSSPDGTLGGEPVGAPTSPGTQS